MSPEQFEDLIVFLGQRLLGIARAPEEA